MLSSYFKTTMNPHLKMQMTCYNTLTRWTRPPFWVRRGCPC